MSRINDMMTRDDVVLTGSHLVPILRIHLLHYSLYNYNVAEVL